MQTLIKSSDRHYADHGWLKTHWHFSFGDYHDPKNVHWSALRVFNDDIVEPDTGFDTHPHRDMEIVTYVIDGTLTHSDSLGHEEPLRAGEVQVMSAGRGIYHGERNADKTTPVHLLQLWFMPRTRGTAPRWEQKAFGVTEKVGQLVPVVSNGSIDGTLKIDQDVIMRVGKLNAGQTLTQANVGSHAYAFVIDGELSINGKALAKGDQLRLADESSIEIVTKTDAHLMLIDLP